MRKVLTFLSASLCLAAVAVANAQQAPDQFKDVDPSHWAYQAVENLRGKGYLIGYPNGYFSGKRTLTRYEFAVAIDRILQNLPTPQKGDKGDPGPQGPPGDRGPEGPQGPPGVRPEELDMIRRLANEFRDQMAAVGNSIAAINRKLDDLGAQVAELRETINKMPKWAGATFLGIRSDRANGPFIDRDGRFFASGSITSPDIIHDTLLTVDGKLTNSATVRAGLAFNNYKNYVGSLGMFTGGLTTAQSGGLTSDAYLDRLEIITPIGGLGRDSNLTIGRFSHKISPLTLWKPDVYSYFSIPWQDDGEYRMDGLRFAGRFGSVSLEAFGAQTMSVTGGNTSAPYNSPFAGSTVGAGPAIFTGGFKPYGQTPGQGHMIVDQLVGVSLGFHVPQLRDSHIRLTAVDASAERAASAAGTFNNVWVLGADIDLKLMDRLTLGAGWSKTNTGTSAYNTVNPHENNAFDARVNYTSGGLTLGAGYRYIDPLFYAPGYWGRIGSWINPTNIQGPTFNAGYDFSEAFGLRVGGNFYSAARNRGPAGLNSEDDITRILVGLRWDLSKNFQTTIDWEGVYWTLDNIRFGGAGKVHPTEHYITLGTGFNLNNSTLLKLMYQIGDFNGHGALNGGSPIARYNFNTITTQVAVKF